MASVTTTRYTRIKRPVHPKSHASPERLIVCLEDRWKSWRVAAVWKVPRFQDVTVTYRSSISIVLPCWPNVVPTGTMNTSK